MAAVNLLPADVARRCELVPVAREGEDTLVVAMADPANVVAIDDVEIQTGMSVQVAVATREDILAVIANMTRLDSCGDRGRRGGARTRRSRCSTSMTRPPRRRSSSSSTRCSPRRSTHGASDVHFEAEAREMRVRIRVDGVLEEIAQDPGADGSRRRLAHQDHVRARHLRAAAAPGRSRRAQRRRQADRHPRRDAADGPRRVGGDADPGPLQRAHRDPQAGARRVSRWDAWRRRPATPTAPCSSPARPDPGSRPRSTRCSTRSTRPTRTSSRSRIPSSISWTASPRSPSTRARA